MRSRMTCLALYCAFFVFSAESRADWSNPVFNPEHVAWRPEITAVADVTKAPVWIAGDYVAAGIAPCVSGNQVLYAAMTGEDFSDTRTQSCRIESRNRNTGELLMQTKELDTTVSVAEGSRSGIVVDAATNSFFYSSGETIYCFDLNTGNVKWESSLATVIDKNVYSTVVVNSSPAYNGKTVFVQTRDYSGLNSVLTAWDAATGLAKWQLQGVGVGMNSPITAKIDDRDVLYICYSPDGFRGGMECLDAETGNSIWRSAWNTQSLFWGEIVLSGNTLVGVTYDPYSYTAEGGELVSVNARTGEKQWQTTVLMSDTAPLVADDRIYIVGGPWGAAKLQAFNLADGLQAFAPVSLRTSIWRNTMVASSNRLFITYGGCLVAHDLVSGAKIAQSPSADYDSAVVLDTDGSLYVTAPDYLTQKQALVRFALKSSVSFWEQMQ